MDSYGAGPVFKMRQHRPAWKCHKLYHRVSLVRPNRLPWPLQEQAFLILQSHFLSFSLPFSPVPPIFILFSHRELVWWGHRCHLGTELIGSLCTTEGEPYFSFCFHCRLIFISIAYSSGALWYFFLSFFPPSSLFWKTMNAFTLLCHSFAVQWAERRGRGESTFSKGSHSPSIPRAYCKSYKWMSFEC